MALTLALCCCIVFFCLLPVPKNLWETLVAHRLPFSPCVALLLFLIALPPLWFTCPFFLQGVFVAALALIVLILFPPSQLFDLLGSFGSSRSRLSCSFCLSAVPSGMTFHPLRALIWNLFLIGECSRQSVLCVGLQPSSGYHRYFGKLFIERTQRCPCAVELPYSSNHFGII